MLQQAALLSSFSLTAAASFWLLQSWLDVKQQLLYTEQLSPVSTLYAFSPSQLIFIWLVSMLVLTLLKASIVISDVKNILGSLQCIALQASSTPRSHVSSFQLAPVYTVGNHDKHFFSPPLLLLSVMHNRLRTSWPRESFLAAACQEDTMIRCDGVLYGRHKIWR